MGRLPVDDSKHGGDQIDCEDIVSIREETDASDDTCSRMIPAEWCLVDFSECQSPSLIWIGYVTMWESARLSTPQAMSDPREIIVEIMESSISTRSGVGHIGLWSPCEAGQAMMLDGLSIFDFFEKNTRTVILLLSC